MVVTDSPEVATRLRSLRAHGTTAKYFSVEQGWNSRLDEMQAAILRVKLRHLDDWIAGRRLCAERYNQLLAEGDEVVRPVVGEQQDHVYHQYTVRIGNRERVQRLMREKYLVPTTVYYPVPIHLQPIYSELGYQPGDLPVTERAAAEVLSLPVYPEMTEEQIACVVEALLDSIRMA